MADAIFISYRRDDSEGEAGRLFDDLTRAFGNNAVFMDVAGIKPGVDFRHAIEDNVASCGVLLAIVGPHWISITNADGTRRLEDPNDFVALEIASALQREVPVIPVLVHDAKMPTAAQLPGSLESFCYRNSVELSHARWNSDVHLLIDALRSYVTPVIPASSETVHANLPVQLPVPHPPAEAIVPKVAQNWLPAALGALGGIVLIVVIIAYFLFKPGPDTAQTATLVKPAESSNGDAASAEPSSAAAPIATQTPVVAHAVVPAVKTAAVTNAKVPGSSFDGTWTRSGKAGNEDALGRLVITGSGSTVLMHAYGRCQTAACDWGIQPGTLDSAGLTATFSPPPSGTDTSRTAQVTAQLTPAGLDVAVKNTFQNPAGSRTNSAHPLFVLAQ